MAKGDVHTSKRGGRWVNKAEGNEHVVHKEDGRIGERNTYPRGRDPRGSKG